MIEVPRDLPKKEPYDENDPLNGQGRLTWRPFGQNVMFVCPNGHDGLLWNPDHTVAEDGTVSPSVVCPYDGCDFHEFVRLLDWPYRPAEASSS